MTRPRLFRALAALLVFLAGTACDRTPVPHPPSYREAVSPFVAPVPTPLPRALALLAGSPRAAELNASIDLVIERTQGFALPFPEAPPGFQAEMERFFVAVGRLGDLLDLYAARVEQGGPGSPFAPRMAVLLTEMGYRSEARTLLDGAAAANPGDRVVEAALAIWILGSPNADPQMRVEGARHLIAAGDETEFEGIFVYGPQWPQRTLARLNPIERRAAAGDLAPLVQERIGAALTAARPAPP